MEGKGGREGRAKGGERGMGGKREGEGKREGRTPHCFLDKSNPGCNLHDSLCHHA